MLVRTYTKSPPTNSCLEHIVGGGPTRSNKAVVPNRAAMDQLD